VRALSFSIIPPVHIDEWSMGRVGRYMGRVGRYMGRVGRYMGRVGRYMGRVGGTSSWADLVMGREWRDGHT
jgi:hypothetical protein